MRERLQTKYGVTAEEVIGGVNLDVFTPRPNKLAGCYCDRLWTVAKAVIRIVDSRCVSW